MFSKNKTKTDPTSYQKADSLHLCKSLSENISIFRGLFESDDTLIVRELENKTQKSVKCCILYIEGMTDIKLVSESIVNAFQECDLTSGVPHDTLLKELKNKVLSSNGISVLKDLNKMTEAILSGDTLFLTDGCEQALSIATKGWQTRAVAEPEAAKILRGPREGFNESLITNLTMVRRKIKNPDLKFRFMELGRQTHTRLCVCHLENVASKYVLDELYQRLSRIDIDSILDSGYIQELIKDAPFSPFETVGSSERPDVIAGKLLEGRVAVFVDGSPFVLTVPFVLAEAVQSNEDYYVNYIFASINRMIRGFSAVVSIAIPAIFLAFVTFHQEMIPTHLLLSMSAARQNIPFPTSVSLFAMLLMFDILREANTRMPSHIGNAISIFGTIVLGQAAVEAKLVSAPVIIITAATGIMSLINLNLIGATIITRTLMLLSASLFGIYGFLLSFIILYLHLMSLRSFGVPYLLSLTRVRDHDGQDAWIRTPWWSMTLRPKVLASKNFIRQANTKNGTGRRKPE